MAYRWKMNRIGFVNFWLYDEEEFEFYDGKLLLRGQNGSGKSITTQSFIPFVLDGDRTPSRLDPFGSSDRRMEYYFLGEEGQDEATGYLYLEFKKEGADEYRTIGIGQRAKRGKPMDFWGFIILDNKRIGYDLWLYKETGSAKIPYEKREMKAVLGDGNIFTDSQGEYKKLVNHYIFGFRRDEQYEQFIRLLVKVRAPKLSKEFKPTKVYEILNESLQTLSDEDLRTMVDAMEKMDEIQDSLEMLNMAFSDIKTIRTEYTRYNQYMLAKKAQFYLKKKEETKAARKEYDEKQDEKNELISEIDALKIESEEFAAKEKLLETERGGLMDSDLEEMDQKLSAARSDREEALEKKRKLEGRIEEFKEKIYRAERDIKDIEDRMDETRDKVTSHKMDLGECQEVLRWEGHDDALRLLGTERSQGCDEITKKLSDYRKTVEECRNLIGKLDEISRRYDEISEALEGVRKEKNKKEQEEAAAKERVEKRRDDWIINLYALAKSAESWHPAEDVLKAAEDEMLGYKNAADAEKIRQILRNDYDRQWRTWQEKKQDIARLINDCEERLESLNADLTDLISKEDIEPKRSEDALQTRQRLKEVGIEAYPFYRTVEFAEGLSEVECARIEAQLECMGLLDALVVSERDLDKIKSSCPEFLDTVIYAPQAGGSGFAKLIPASDVPEHIAISVRKILGNIYEKGGSKGTVSLFGDGTFVQGVLTGKARKSEAEFLGRMIRQRKKEEKIRLLRDMIGESEAELSGLKEQEEHIAEGLDQLDYEYNEIPDFYELTVALEELKNCSGELERITAEYAKVMRQERECEEEKKACHQQVIVKCKTLPYGRTQKEYDEVIDTLDEYLSIWGACKALLAGLSADTVLHGAKSEQLEQNEQILDDSFADKRSCDNRIKECDIKISRYEEYLNSPEIAEKARRLEELKAELIAVRASQKTANENRIRDEERLDGIVRSESEQKEKLLELIAGESVLERLFEEELSLKLVVERGNRTLEECGKEAVKLLRDSDKNREYGDMFQSLVGVYQKHNGSLANYGTALEECFESVEDWPGVGENFAYLRKRVRVVSAWNGKKVFLEEFYGILKTAIEETELLIRQKDRELFEDILSQTISRQLTDKIAESRIWVKDMSELMRDLDTSMGLTFSLEWKPRSAENDTELDTMELEQILLRDRELLTTEDIEKVAEHFRSKIRMEKTRLSDGGDIINYMELVRDALDYRRWFEFRMYYRRGSENKKPLTNAAFNRFSGGEKAMAMYVPLFAAVNAQYKKADNKDHPRIVALDEAFAGVDDKNISSMFELVDKMDFDYIMNSQSLWGCFETVKGLKISELHRPKDSQVVTIIRYTWNGHERMLDVQ